MMFSTKKNIMLSVLTIFCNVVLFFIKLYVALVTGSICIYTDAVNNLADCFAGILAVFGFIVLAKNKNQKYPFGFGRVQELITFIMTCIIIVAGCIFLYSSVERFFYPTPVAFTAKYQYLLIATACVKILIAFFLHFANKKSNSKIVANMELDCILDFFISLITVMSFSVSAYSSLAVDGLAGIIISFIIIISGIKNLIPIVKRIIGRRDDEECDKAEKFIESYGVSVYEIQCHSYGDKKIFTALVSENDKITDLSQCFNDKYGYELFINFIRE